MRVRGWLFAFRHAIIHKLGEMQTSTQSQVKRMGSKDAQTHSTHTVTDKQTHAEKYTYIYKRITRTHTRSHARTHTHAYTYIYNHTLYPVHLWLARTHILYCAWPTKAWPVRFRVRVRFKFRDRFRVRFRFEVKKLYD